MKAEIAAAIQEIAASNGGMITPEQVVDAAKSETSPLHSYFTWDLGKAAHERWLDQARTLIRSIKVEVRTTQFTVHAPAFVRDPSLSSDTQGYSSLGRLRTDVDMAREAVIAEFGRASAAMARAQAVAAALNMTDEIDEVRGRILSLAEIARQEQVNPLAA